MASTVFPAASAGGKTEFVTTLTSGTAYTVPAGVNFMNVILTGGGGGGPFAASNSSISTAVGAGGTTTFTGATSASGGGAGNQHVGPNNSGAPNTISNSGSGVVANTGKGGKRTTHANNSANGTPATQHVILNNEAFDGQVIQSTLNTTPGGTINYAIGAGGVAGISFGSDNNSNHSASNPGGSGKIEVHYWA